MTIFSLRRLDATPQTYISFLDFMLAHILEYVNYYHAHFFILI